jgi:hypothetical protein
MEQQLFGLASAIEDFQEEFDSSDLLPVFLEDEDFTAPATSVAALEQNASLLYQRANAGQIIRNPNSEDESESMYTSRSYRNLMHYKKTDGDCASVGSAHLTPDPAAENTPIMKNGEFTEESASVKLGDMEEGRESGANLPKTALPNPKRRRSSIAGKKGLSNFRELKDFFAPQKTTIALYFRVMFLYLASPLLGIAAVLFYFAGCPPTGRLQNGGYPFPDGKLLNENGDIVDPNQASIAWYLIFVVRLIVTFTLAKCTEIILIDYLTIRSRSTMNVLGPWMTLFILQSRVSYRMRCLVGFGEDLYTSQPNN